MAICAGERERIPKAHFYRNRKDPKNTDRPFLSDRQKRAHEVRLSGREDLHERADRHVCQNAEG